MADTAHAVVLAAHTAIDVARGVSRLLLAEGMTPILEFSLPNGRRLDVAALGPDGSFVGVEIKVSLGDLAADAKWPDYLTALFYFAVPPDFRNQHHGIGRADCRRPFRRHDRGCRAHDHTPAAARYALSLRFARLARTLDPHCP
jgi:hypothetical protein